jgi:ABC-type amino acid transport substrate-binding protein
MPARLAALLLTALLCGTTQAQALQIVGTDVPPLIYQHQGRAQGFCVDLVQALQQRLKENAPSSCCPGRA